MRPSPHSTTTLDYLGIFGHIVLITYTASPWAVTTFVLALDIRLDPVFLIIKHCTPAYWNASLLQVYFLCRPVYMFPIMQVARSLCFAILIGTLTGPLIINFCEHMDTTAFRVSSHLRSRTVKYFRDYDTLRICTTGIFKAFGAIIFFSLTTVFMLTVIANFISIRLRKEIPMSIYIYFPSMGLLGPITMQVILSFVVAINDKTNTILANCKLNIIRSNEMKYVRRRIRAMQPICIYGEMGGFKLFKCRRSTRAEYFSLMLNYTVTALMTWERV